MSGELMLGLAARNGHLETVTCLVEMCGGLLHVLYLSVSSCSPSADPCVRDTSTLAYSPLQYAVLYGHIDVIEYLLSLRIPGGAPGAPPVPRIGVKQSLTVHTAVGMQDQTIMCRLRKQKIAGKTVGASERSIEAWHYRLQIVDILLQAGADINAASTSLGTPVYYAGTSRCYWCESLLIHPSHI